MSRLHREIDAKTIESTLDIIDVISRYTDLKKYGGRYTGLCPSHSERSPSFSVKGKSFTCYACGFSGSGVIDFIMKKENLTFPQALEFLKKELPTSGVVKKSIKKISVQDSFADIEFVDCDFTEQHSQYWEKLQMDQKWLNSKNVFAVKEWALGYNRNLKKIPFSKDEIVFAYYAEDIKKCKILRLGENVNPKDKWRTSVPNNYLWYYNDYVDKPCDVGFTVKSVKDCLIVQKTGRCAIATNNESDRILLENNVDRINSLFKHNIMCYGTDPDGKKKSIAITKETGWGWFNMENHLYEQFLIEDFADYLNAGFTYKQLERLFKNKKL